MASQRKADAMNYLNNWAKGLNDMHMWRKMMNLYEEDVNSRKQNNTPSTSAPKAKISKNNVASYVPGVLNFLKSINYGIRS